MRTAFVVLALATVCLAAAIEKTDIPVQIVEDSVPASLVVESSDVAASVPHSRAKRTLLLKKLKLAKLAVLGKVAKVALIGTALGGLAGGLGGFGGGRQQQHGSYSSSQQTYSQGPTYIPPPQQSYGGGHSISGHTEYVVAYAPSNHASQ